MPQSVHTTCWHAQRPQVSASSSHLEVLSAPLSPYIYFFFKRKQKVSGVDMLYNSNSRSSFLWEKRLFRQKTYSQRRVQDLKGHWIFQVMDPYLLFACNFCESMLWVGSTGFRWTPNINLLTHTTISHSPSQPHIGGHTQITSPTITLRIKFMSYSMYNNNDPLS